MEQKNYLNDSFTAYKNKIGLTIDGKFLNQRNEVALVWPYKDCVLEGGQSREEQSREEIFFNQTLAQDEITQLLDPKVLTNARRYSTDAPDSEAITDFTRNEAGYITDNLIIKGNNLLALHSLKGQFTGRVKLIYIDPPYNTGNDGFQYNDRFNHSSWLTFMRNRLEVARELLDKTGLICIQITDFEQPYLRVLTDEIFGRENFIEQVIWKKRSGAPNDKVIGAVHEYIVLYARSMDSLKIYRKERAAEQISRYKNPDNHSKGPWTSGDLMANVKGGRYVQSLYFSVVNPNTGEEHYPSSNGNWRFNKAQIQKLLNNNEIYFGEDGKGRPKLKRFLCDVKDGVPYDTLWLDKVPLGSAGTKEIEILFGSVNHFDTPKPEGLIAEILRFATQPGDIVLDYHLGSGTTAAVAHKMGRQYIGVEQMDYIETVTVERLKKVVAGEQGGISKSVGWAGGGAFTYLELKKYNETFMEQIAAAPDTAALLDIWNAMKQRSFLAYNIDLKAQDKHLDEFKTLTLQQQKELLARLLDKNQLYVNQSAMHDADFGVTDEDKQLTTAFYQR